LKTRHLLTLFMMALLALSLSPAITAQDEPIELTFVQIFGSDPEGDNRAAVIREIADEFTAANPNVTIVVESSSTEYGEVLNNALLAADQGNAPNIVQIEEGFTQLAIDSGYFIPISDVATEEQLATLDDVLPTVRAYYSIGADIWSIPWNSSNPLLYYNRSMFEAAGLDPDDPPSTFDEVLEACDAIMSADLELTACINWPMATWFAEQWVAMQGGLIVNNENGREGRATEVLYNSEEMLRVATWWKELVDQGYYTYSGSPIDYNGEGITFLSQQTAMTINSTAGLTLFLRFSSLQGIDLGVAPLPMPDEDATNGITVGGASLWLSADQSEAELQAAADFIFFLTNTMNDQKWHKGTGYMPTRASSVEALIDEGWFEENPFFRIAVDQLIESELNTATSGAVIGPSEEVRGYLTEAFQSIVDGGADPAEALQVAKERSDAELEEYNSFFGE